MMARKPPVTILEQSSNGDLPRSTAGQRSRVERVFGAWHAYQWHIVALLALAAFVLGVIGIHDYAKTGRLGQMTTSDVLYLALQLFIWQSGGIFLGPGVGWELHVARFLAPLATLYAAAQALLILFAEQHQLVRARFIRDHVVICGLGREGLLLAGNLCAAGLRIVAIEQTAQKPSIRRCRRFGAVIVGDATDRRSLKAAGVDRARHLVAVCGDDGVNAEVAAQAASLAAHRSPVLTCHVHIADRDLWEAIRERGLSTPDTEGVRFEFFNLLDAGARALLSQEPGWSDPPAEGVRPHVIVVGLGQTGERLLVDTARLWRARGRWPDERLQITVLDTDATRKTHRLLIRYARLGDTCELVPLDIDVGSPDFEARHLLSAYEHFTIAYVCLDDDGLGLATGLSLFHRTRAQGRIVVCTTHKAGLATLMKGIEEGDVARDHIHLFALLDEACTPDLLFGGTRELLARAIHDAYRAHQAGLGQTLETNPAVAPWEQLPESIKESNRSQAAHIGVKLDAVGCSIAPLTDWDADRFTFTNDELERLARLEHHRWIAERLRGGWIYDPGPKNLEKKTSPYLVDWDLLPESIRELDRNTVRNLSNLLAAAGFRVYRRKAGAESSGSEGEVRSTQSLRSNSSSAQLDRSHTRR